MQDQMVFLISGLIQHQTPNLTTGKLFYVQLHWKSKEVQDKTVHLY